MLSSSFDACSFMESNLYLKIQFFAAAMYFFLKAMHDRMHQKLCINNVWSWFAFLQKMEYALVLVVSEKDVCNTTLNQEKIAS